MIRLGDPGFVSESYLAAKAHWKGLPPRSRSRGGARSRNDATLVAGARDPQTLGELLAGTAQDFGWNLELEQARLIAEWPEFIGETTAEHTQIRELRDGILIVQCDSTAWATELRRLRAQILSRILEEYPQSAVQDLRFLAPGVPSWRHGPRSVPGRGPRDTYG